MSTRRFLVGLSLLLLALAALPRMAQAHAFAPALLELRGEEDGAIAVRFKQPTTQASPERLRPVFPKECQPLDEVAVTAEGSGIVQGTGIVARWRIRCEGGSAAETVGNGLIGKAIAVRGIAASRADVLLRLELEGGVSVRHVLTADRPSFVVPEGESILDVALAYGRLGVEHIASGFDHLLFVLGLLLLVTGGRRLVATITAFTVGHSITLALAVLGVVSLPSRPIEALIALSIYVLAVELTRQQQEGTLMRRSPWLVAGGFGLLHGMGFAGALTEVGLPQQDIPAALLAFNLGIELGQLAFVALVLGAWAHAKRLLALVREDFPINCPPALQQAPAYLIGCLAVYWFLQRVVG